MFIKLKFLWVFVCDSVRWVAVVGCTLRSGHHRYTVLVRVVFHGLVSRKEPNVELGLALWSVSVRFSMLVWWIYMKRVWAYAQTKVNFCCFFFVGAQQQHREKHKQYFWTRWIDCTSQTKSVCSLWSNAICIRYTRLYEKDNDNNNYCAERMTFCLHSLEQFSAAAVAEVVLRPQQLPGSFILL